MGRRRPRVARMYYWRVVQDGETFTGSFGHFKTMGGVERRLLRMFPDLYSCEVQEEPFGEVYPEPHEMTEAIQGTCPECGSEDVYAHPQRDDVEYCVNCGTFLTDAFDVVEDDEGL